MKYDTILFDADNTLLDFHRAEAEALKTVFAQYRLELTEKRKALYQRINSALWVDFEAERCTKDDIMRLRFQRLFEKEGILEDGAAFNSAYMEALGNGAFVMEGAPGLCRSLFPVCRLYLITNGVSKTQHRRFEACGLAPWFSGVFVSEDAGSQKPSKDFFDYVLYRIPGAASSRMLIVGDTLTSDIQGGNNAGIDACWYNPERLPNCSAARPDYEIHTLEELLPLINGENKIQIMQSEEVYYERK